MTPSEEESTGRTLVSALLAMLGVAVVIGLSVGLVLLGLVHFSGMGGGNAADEGPPTLAGPEASPTPRASPSSTPASSRAPRPTPAITLTATPATVAPGGRIDLSGAYPGGDGRLQVQRRESGAWVDFPVSAAVSAGRFQTWVETSRSGPSAFRVVDAGGKTSNVVVVTVG